MHIADSVRASVVVRCAAGRGSVFLADSISSVLELQSVEVRAVQPTMASFGQIHGEIHMSPEGAESSTVESPDGVYVAGHWANGKVFIASGDRRGHDAIDQQPPDPSATEPCGNDNGFNLPAGPAIEKASEPHDRSLGLGDPGSHSFGYCQVGVESCSRIVASNQTVLVDPTMLFSKFDPQHPAG